MTNNNIAIFASGSGSNAENIIRYFKGSKLVSKVLILTENPKAYVLERAKRLSVEVIQFDLADLHNGVIFEILNKHSINFIVLAGFLRLIPKELAEAYNERIVNIHPALLPKFGGKGMYGIKVHKAVLLGGETESGITIHYVNPNYDEGSIIFQAQCPVLQCDKPETLAERIHELEHEHYPKVIEELLKKL